MAYTVKDALAADCQQVKPETTCREARKLLHALDERCLFVVEKRRAVGVLTTSSFLREHDLDDPVSKIMASPVLSVDEGETLKEAAKLLANHRVNQLAVTAKGEFKGMITQRDVVKDLIVDTRQPRLTPERAAIYLSMTNEMEREEHWLKQGEEEGYKCVCTQVGATADKLPIKLREAAIVAAIANGVIRETPNEKIALSNAVRDAYAQLALVNPGLGGGFKMAVVRGEGRIAVACFGKSGHALANGPAQIVTGYSIIGN